VETSKIFGDLYSIWPRWPNTIKLDRISEVRVQYATSSRSNTNVTLKPPPPRNEAPSVTKLECAVQQLIEAHHALLVTPTDAPSAQ
jgi:hypothetical protein